MGHIIDWSALPRILRIGAVAIFVDIPVNFLPLNLKNVFFLFKTTVVDFGCKYIVFISHSTSDGTNKCVSISTKAFKMI